MSTTLMQLFVIMIRSKTWYHHGNCQKTWYKHHEKVQNMVYHHSKCKKTWYHPLSEQFSDLKLTG